MNPEVRDMAATAGEISAQIATLTRWRDHLTSWRAELDRQLLAIKSPIRDDATRKRAMALGMSIERIDRGLDSVREWFPADLPLSELMRASGYTSWIGTLSETEQSLRELRQRRDDAQVETHGAPLSEDCPRRENWK